MAWPASCSSVSAALTGDGMSSCRAITPSQEENSPKQSLPMARSADSFSMPKSNGPTRNLGGGGRRTRGRARLPSRERARLAAGLRLDRKRILQLAPLPAREAAGNDRAAAAQQVVAEIRARAREDESTCPAELDIGVAR